MGIIENGFVDLGLGSEEDESAEEAELTEDRADKLRQSKDDLKAANTAKQLLEALRSKAQDKDVVNAVTDIIAFGSNNSGTQNGVVYGGISGVSFGGK